MIVQDAGKAWQIVLQLDHAKLAGDLARMWGGSGYARPERFDSVVAACDHHDDGWAIWERTPDLDLVSARPRTFFTVPYPYQMDFYRANIATLSDLDPHAALIVSMHACGLFGADYGWTDIPPLPEGDRARGAAFVAEQEATHADRSVQLGLGPAERWTAYHILQICDRLSLFFCGVGVPADGQPKVLQHAGRSDGTDSELLVETIDASTFRLDPFPFLESPARFVLRRRIVPKQSWADRDAFHRSFWETRVDETPITIVDGEVGLHSERRE
jgi:hypothetical protein